MISGHAALLCGHQGCRSGASQLHSQPSPALLAPVCNHAHSLPFLRVYHSTSSSLTGSCHLSLFPYTVAFIGVLFAHPCTYSTALTTQLFQSGRDEVQGLLSMFGSKASYLSSLPHGILQTTVLTGAQQLDVVLAHGLMRVFLVHHSCV